MKDQISNEDYLNQLKKEQEPYIRDVMIGKRTVSDTACTTGELTGTGTSTNFTENNFCWHRLPCGMCRLTGMQCPKAGPYEVPSYPYSPITLTSTGVSVNPNVAVQPDRCTGQQFTDEQMSQMTTATGKYDPNLKAMN